MTFLDRAFYLISYFLVFLYTSHLFIVIGFLISAHRYCLAFLDIVFLWDTCFSSVSAFVAEKSPLYINISLKLVQLIFPVDIHFSFYHSPLFKIRKRFSGCLFGLFYYTLSLPVLVSQTWCINFFHPHAKFSYFGG